MFLFLLCFLVHRRGTRPRAAAYLGRASTSGRCILPTAVGNSLLFLAPLLPVSDCGLLFARYDNGFDLFFVVRRRIARAQAASIAIAYLRDKKYKFY